MICLCICIILLIVLCFVVYKLLNNYKISGGSTMSKPYDNNTSDLNQIRANSGFNYLNPNIERYVNDKNSHQLLSLDEISDLPQNYNLVLADYGSNTYVNLFAPCIFVDKGQMEYGKNKEAEIIHVSASANGFMEKIKTLRHPPKFNTIFVDWGLGGNSVINKANLMELKHFINSNGHIFINHENITLLSYNYGDSGMKEFDDTYHIRIPKQTNEDGYSNFSWVKNPEETPIRDKLWLNLPEYVTWKVKNGFRSQEEKANFMRYWNLSQKEFEQCKNSSETDLADIVYSIPDKAFFYELVIDDAVKPYMNGIIYQDACDVLTSMFGKDRIIYDENTMMVTGIKGGITYDEFNDLLDKVPSQRFKDTYLSPSVTEDMAKRLEDQNSQEYFDLMNVYNLQIMDKIDLAYEGTFKWILANDYSKIDEFKIKDLKLIYEKLILGCPVPPEVWNNLNVYNIIKLTSMSYDTINNNLPIYNLSNRSSIIYSEFEKSTKPSMIEKQKEAVTKYFNYLLTNDNILCIFTYFQAKCQIPKSKIMESFQKKYNTKTEVAGEEEFIVKDNDDGIFNILSNYCFSGIYEIIPK